MFATLERSNYPLQSSLKIHRRLITYQTLNFAAIRYTPGHVLKTLFVGAVVGDVDDLRLAASHPLYQFCQCVDCNFPCVADIENLADSRGLRVRSANALTTSPT